MKMIDAAAVVLEEANAPLHCREIAERMRTKGLWAGSGKTLWNTISARIGEEIQEKGAAARFQRLSKGMYAFNASGASGSAHFAAEPKPEVRRENQKRWLSFMDAAERILKESSGRQPLHYGVITAQALQQRLIRTEGRTPAATMYSNILTEVHQREARGESPRFVQHGRGMVGLAAWQPPEVAGLVEKKNREVRQALLQRAKQVSSDDFEKLISELLAAMGFADIEVTRSSNDGGIDLRGTLVVGGTVRIRMAVQAKCWKANVQKPVVQQVRGSLGAHEQGLIVTTSDFSRGAQDEAQRSDAAPVALINGEQLAVLLAKHKIGARVEPYELYVLDDEAE